MSLSIIEPTLATDLLTYLCPCLAIPIFSSVLLSAGVHPSFTNFTLSLFQSYILIYLLDTVPPLVSTMRVLDRVNGKAPHHIWSDEDRIILALLKKFYNNPQH